MVLEVRPLCTILHDVSLADSLWALPLHSLHWLLQCVSALSAVLHLAAFLLHVLAAHASRCAASVGEYPLASSSASERAESNKALRFRRGEMVVCTFTMQVRANAHAALSC